MSTTKSMKRTSIKRSRMWMTVRRRGMLMTKRRRRRCQ